MILGVRMIESLYKTSTNVNGAAVMVERRALEEIGGYPTGSLADDALLAWRLALNGLRVIVAWDALAYTRDPGSLRGIAWKSQRIAAGLLQAWAKTLPRALAGRNWYLALGATYNALGGLPLLLGLVQLSATSLLLAAGALHETLAYRLALLLPNTPLRHLVTAFLAEPLTYLALLYLLSAAEAALLALGLSQAYKRHETLHARLRAAARHAPFFPLVLWVAATSLLAAPLYLAARLLRGERLETW